MPKPNISTTWGEIKKRLGREGIEFIQVRDLGKYGFTDAIVTDMVKFDIFPQAYVVCGAYYVLRDEIFGQVVRKLLENSMAIYQAVQDKDQVLEAVKAAMEDVVMDEEAIAKLASGEWTMDQVRERSKAILADRAAADLVEEMTPNPAEETA